MTVYQPLQEHLAKRSEPSVVMSYAEIEKLLGRALPPTAYGDKKRQWWANTETHSQALAWLRAKRKAKLDVQRQEVAFIRQPEATSSSQTSSEDESLGLKGLSPAALRMLKDIAEERGVSPAEAGVTILNEMALRRRAATLDWFAGKSVFSDISSAEMVREDRNGR